MSNSPIQNIGCFAGIKMGWFLLNITEDAKYCYHFIKKNKENYLRKGLMMQLIIKGRLGDC